MCYCEESYESVCGDEGYLDNPPINHERLAYLEELGIGNKSSQLGD